MRAFPFSRFLHASLMWVAGGGTLARAELTAEQRAQLPPAATRRIDFARDIQPIFEASCVQCHARGKSKGAFSLETREDFMEGGDSGAPATSGDGGQSLLVAMVSGLDPEIVMPKKGKKLTPEQVSLVRAWVDQGMAWPESITFHRHEPANLRARDLAELKTSERFPNPVDGWVDAAFAARGAGWPEVVDDRRFARRVWLDAIGRLPPPAELEAFLADRAANKRERLVQRLLGDDQAYAEHWLTFWNDLLRNDYKGTGYIDGGRKQITGWLYAALARNLPYDQFVAELINPGADAEGFTNGILWRGAVNASMVPPMQAAQSVAQVFLGVNLKCASCHDSFINEYTLQDSYGLATIYAHGPLEIAECDKPTGQMGRVKFLYEEIGRIDTQADPAARKRQLADVITGRQNGRLPRTIVNRLWQRFFGYGLVEPVDEMDRAAWSPPLLDWLAEDLVANGYNLKHTLARLFTSRAYQLPAVDLGETSEHFVFRGPGVRRMDAEQFSDALMTLMGLNYGKPDAKVNREAWLRPAATVASQPQWIWSTPHAELKARPGKVVFRREVTLATAPSEAMVTLAADNNYALTVNGASAGSSTKRTGTGTEMVDIAKWLKAGVNTLEVTVTNALADGTNPRSPEEAAQANDDAAEENPAGLILFARIRAGAEIVEVVSDANWSAAAGDRTGPAVELGDVTLAPWRLGAAFLQTAVAPADRRPVERASLLAANPLMTALGRPNREQVVTVRQGTATTLQALELTNGATLAEFLEKGADQVLQRAAGDGRQLLDTLYLQAFSRPPTERERSLALPLVGAPMARAGVQDLLWTLAMLPEFQLIQ